MLPDDPLTWSLFMEIADQAHDGILVVDGAGLILYTNPAYERFIGVDREYARKTFWGQSIFGMNALSELGRVLKTGQAVHGGQLVIERAGLEITYSIIPIVNQRAVVGAVIIGTIPQVVSIIDVLLQANHQYQRDYMKFRPKASLPEPFQKIIGNNVAFVKKLVKAAAAAKTESNILLQGESGTGKELLAHAVHESSPRHDGPFVVVNCAAIPDTLLESELFGYEPGAFTGAGRMGKRGKFELAHQGTVFLDEVGDLPLSIQAKLLRAIQFKQVEKLGGSELIPVDVRIIAATNKNLEIEVKENRFREDLYYRLCVIPIDLPPLRERKKEDIYTMTEHFLSMFCRRYSHPGMGFGPEALMMLYRYHWPGNIRELHNAVEHAFVLAYAENLTLIFPRHLPARILKTGPTPAFQTDSHPAPETRATLKSLLKPLEQALIRQALHENNFDKKKTATYLGISRAKLYAALKEMKPR